MLWPYFVRVCILIYIKIFERRESKKIRIGKKENSKVDAQHVVASCVLTRGAGRNLREQRIDDIAKARSDRAFLSISVSSRYKNNT